MQGLIDMPYAPRMAGRICSGCRQYLGVDYSPSFAPLVLVSWFYVVDGPENLQSELQARSRFDVAVLALGRTASTMQQPVGREGAVLVLDPMVVASWRPQRRQVSVETAVVVLAPMLVASAHRPPGKCWWGDKG